MDRNTRQSVRNFCLATEVPSAGLLLQVPLFRCASPMRLSSKSLPPFRTSGDSHMTTQRAHEIDRIILTQ